jgi:hypothetical protein
MGRPNARTHLQLRAAFCLGRCHRGPVNALKAAGPSSSFSENRSSQPPFVSVPLEDSITIYKRLGSPYCYYDFDFEKR